MCEIVTYVTIITCEIFMTFVTVVTCVVRIETIGSARIQFNRE